MINEYINYSFINKNLYLVWHLKVIHDKYIFYRLFQNTCYRKLHILSRNDIGVDLNGYILNLYDFELGYTVAAQ